MNNVRRFSLPEVIEVWGAATPSTSNINQSSNDEDFNTSIDNHIARTELDTAQGRILLDKLSYKVLPFLKSKGFGSDNEGFEAVTTALAKFVDTRYESEARAIWREHCESVGGDFDYDRDTKRFDSFADSSYGKDIKTPASLIYKAKQLGWSETQLCSADSEIFSHFGSSTLTPPDWLIEDFIEKDTLTVIYGPPAAGKSLIALDMAFCIATGKDWHNNKVVQGGVFYIAGEGLNGLTRRREAWQCENAISLGEAPLFNSKQPLDIGNLDADAFVRQVETLCDCYDVPPALIVIDTLAKNFGSRDENSTQDMNAFINAVNTVRSALKCAIIIVHHTGKDSSRGERGNSALRAGIDQSYEVKKSDTVSMACKKIKDSELPNILHFSIKSVTIEDNGDLIGSACLELAVPSEPKKNRIGGNERQVLEVMTFGPATVLSIVQNTDLTTKQVNSALKTLISKREVHQNDDGSYETV